MNRNLKLAEKIVSRIERVEKHIANAIEELSLEMGDLSSIEVKTAIMAVHSNIVQMELEDMIRNNIDPSTNEPFISPELDN